MKRIALSSVLLVAVFFLLLVLVQKSPDPKAPRFEKLDAPTVIPATHAISSQFLDSRPFEGGKMWILAVSNRKDFSAFVFDIDRRTVLGELKNGWPELLNRNQTKALCAQPAPPPSRLRQRFLKIVDRLTQGRIKSVPRVALKDEAQRYWLVDMSTGSARRVGDIPGIPDFTFVPSPDFRYCYTMRHGQRLELDVYFLDLDKATVRKMDTRDWPCGWWDTQNLLLQSTNRDFILHNHRTQRTSLFLSSAQIGQFFRESSIPDDPTKTRAIFMWNGRDYDFYLTDGHQRWLARESYLIKVERPHGKLKLVTRQFKFEWSDHIDPTGQYYLYSGREAGERSSGVFVREMSNGTNRTLIQSDGGKYFSIPRFYRDSVIYHRSNALWRINLDGSRNIRLFPP